MVGKNGIWRDGCFLQTQSSQGKSKTPIESYAIIFQNTQASTITIVSVGSLTACKLAIDELVKLKEAQYKGMYCRSVSFDGVTIDTNVMDAIHRYLYVPKSSRSTRKSVIESKMDKLDEPTMTKEEDLTKELDQQSSKPSVNTSEQLQVTKTLLADVINVSELKQYHELMALYEVVREYYEVFPDEYSDTAEIDGDSSDDSEEEEDDDDSDSDSSDDTKQLHKKKLQEQYMKAVAEINRIMNLKVKTKKKKITILAPWQIIRDGTGTKYLVPLSPTTNPSKSVGWTAITEDKKQVTSSQGQKDDSRISDGIWILVKRTLMILNVGLETGWKWEPIMRIENKAVVEDIHKVEEKHFVPIDAFLVHTDYIKKVSGKLLFHLNTIIFIIMHYH